METKSSIFIVLGSLLVIAILSSIPNFVSAYSYECFGRELDHYFCVVTHDDGSTFVFECVNSNCHPINKVTVTPGLKAEIDATVKELGPSNPNDSKDLGGMKTDKGITKSPIN